MSKITLLQNVSPEELTELIKESVKSLLQDFKGQLNHHDPHELLTREETYKLLQIDSSTLWKWTKKGKVVAYGIGNRRYYKRAELLESLTPLNKIS